MSRQIDLSKKLSDEDRDYLISRGRLDDVRANDADFGQDQERFQVIDDGNTGDVDPFKRDDGSDLMAGTHPGERALTPVQQIETGVPPEEVTGLPPTEPSQQAGDATGEGSDSRSFDDDYDAEEDGKPVWTKEDLEEEAQKRGLPKSGNKSDLIKRLREDDAKDAGS
jgi:hypothetical protein